MTYRVKIKDRNKFLADVVYIEAQNSWEAIKKAQKKCSELIPFAVFVELCDER